MVNFAYICFDSFGHIDWGGTMETLVELKNQGHQVSVFTGKLLKRKIEQAGLNHEYISIGTFKPTKEGKPIEETLKEHQEENFFDLESLKNQIQETSKLIQKKNIEYIISDPLCKVGPLTSFKYKIPFATVGAYNYEPEEKVKQANENAIKQYEKNYDKLMNTLNIPQGKNLGLVLQSDLLNVSYSTPRFDQGKELDYVIHVGADKINSRKSSNKKINIFYSAGTIFWSKEQIDEVLSLANNNKINLHITRSNILPNIKKKKNTTTYNFVNDKELIKEMDILITQGGLGTVTTGIRSGTPMIVLPLFYYNIPQALKVDAYGNGISSKSKQYTSLQDAVFKIITDESYSAKAKILQQEYSQLGGSKKATELILSSFSKYKNEINNK